MRIKIIAVIFLILILLYNYVGVVRNLVEKTFLPSKFNEYSFLSDNTVESKDYQIKKIIDGELEGAILFNTLTKDFIINVRDSDSDRYNQGWCSLWKINKYGKIIDSITTNKSIAKHQDFLLEDSIFNQAISANKVKITDFIISLDDVIKPFHKWSDMNNFIYLQKNIKTSREFNSFYDINNTSRSGWNGTGYFQLIHNSSFLYFKANTFKSSRSFYPNISMYLPPNYSRKINTGFLVLGKNSVRSTRAYKEVGVYLIIEK